MKPLDLVFFRHGLAGERGDPAFPVDEDRPLTEEGIRKTRLAAFGLKRLDLECDKVLTSPWLRARQTAEIVADVLGAPPPVHLAELAGDRSPADLIAGLAANHGQRTLLVGHEPLMGATIARVLKGDFAVDLKKAGACALRVAALPSRKPGTLLWLMTSGQLRMIAKKAGGG